MGEHAYFSPSAASRWIKCSASLDRQKPETESPAAAEGTKAHKILEQYWKDLKLPAKTPKEMGDAVITAVDYVITHKLWTEETALYPEQLLKGQDERLFGTADIIIQKGDELGLFDFKYGKGVKVSIEENAQLLTYAYLALRIFPYKKITLGILQPRLDNMVEKTYTAKQVIAWAKKYLAPVIVEGKREYSPGEEQCFFCPAKGDCEAYAEWMLKQASVEFSDFTKTFDSQASGARIGKILDMKAMINQWLDAVAAEAMSRMTRGEKIPGWKIVAGRANRRWKKTLNIEKILLDNLGESCYIKKIVSPAQAEKLGFNSNEYAEKPEGKPTLAPADDKRKALNVTTDFEGYLK